MAKKILMVQKKKVNDEQDKYVHKLPGADNDIEILNPQGQKAIKLRKIKNKISTGFFKRLELEHIDNTIRGMSAMPDFGFDPEVYKGKCNGWEMVMEIMNDMGKYERVLNFKQAHDYEKKEREKIEQKKQKLMRRQKQEQQVEEEVKEVEPTTQGKSL